MQFPCQLQFDMWEDLVKKEKKSNLQSETIWIRVISEIYFNKKEVQVS